jgi:hypothetical protein
MIEPGGRMQKTGGEPGRSPSDGMRQRRFCNQHYRRQKGHRDSCGFSNSSHRFFRDRCAPQNCVAWSVKMARSQRG